MEHALTAPAARHPAVPVRRVGDEHRGAVLFGECLADPAEVERAFSATGAVSPARALEVLRAFPGRYGVVCHDMEETAVTGDLAGVLRIWFGAGAPARFALTPTALFGPGLPRVDPGGLAARLFIPDAVGTLPGGDPFQGITELPQDHMLVVRDGTARMERLRSPFRPEAGGDPVEASRTLADALTRAVTARLPRSGRISADLSGGMDSSFTALLAARHHREGVQAITYTDRFADNADDLAHASRLAGTDPSLRHRVVHGGPDTLPFSLLDRAPFTDLPGTDVVLHARTARRLSPALGTEVHFAGDGGDAVIGAPLTYLAALAHTREFLRECRGWAALRQRPAHRVLRAAWAVSRQSYADALLNAAERLSRPAAADRPDAPPLWEAALTWTAVSPLAAWGTPWARREAAERLRQAAASVQEEDDGTDAHALRAVRWHAAISRPFLQVAHAHGVRVALPFFDHQVLAACLSVPARHRVSTAQVKPLLAQAWRTTFPTVRFERSTKGDYGACEYHGVRRNADRLRSLFRESRLGDLGVIRPDLVLAVLDAAVEGRRVAMGALADAVAAEVWLRGLDRCTVPAEREEQA
ncbi:asparagine synthase-related protein [Nocardiopsis changdeensis]|uniref:Asparagine synthetase B family protein n=1 Tax=Nocardiopsis changdeensis TaxID=2831969 RepID=A0ABX8BM51_9ACTN|nr:MULTISPECIES: asparagine synthase-related protein [Nocardiopsis]QUX23251.1 asparagine synthetase B family protein [Nocardiopsis changdeensis]QYX39193.1 asparagine synthetase B family protein [Nocardiopsis sp. MT53]